MRANPQPGPTSAQAAERRAEIAACLARVRSRIGAACAAAGRDAAGVTLIAVTKTYPASDVLALAGLGLTDFGENRDQEAAAKAAEVAAALAAPSSGFSGSIARTPSIEALKSAREPVRWHFIGQLQTNKARHVAGYADVVHSVDRARLARALGAAARAAGRDLTCLIQVSLDPADADAYAAGAVADPGRGGVPPAGLAGLAAAIEAEQGLTLGGLMAVAPRFTDPRAAFAPLRRLSDVIRSVNPRATVISAGMSGDLEAAIESGATHLRIGTALLGDRRPPVL